MRPHITVTASVPKDFWEYNGSAILDNCYLGFISLFRPLFSAVLDVDLAKDQSMVLSLLLSGMHPIACRHFHVLEKFCSLSFSDRLAFHQHKAQVSVLRGEEQQSALSFSQTLFLLCKCSMAIVVGRPRRKTAVGEMSLNFGFKSSGSEKTFTKA